MVAISTLRAAGTALRCLQSPLCRYSLTLIPKSSKSLVSGGGGVRLMSEGHNMRIQPSRYEWRQFKDHFHLFLALGLIPMGILIFCVNTFIGQSELAEIPEDYEPQHWEYFKHPIQRWFSRYVYDNPQKNYEKMCHLIDVENQKRQMRLIEKKVRNLMADRQDVRGWYYVPANDRHVYVGREFVDETKSIHGRN